MIEKWKVLLGRKFNYVVCVCYLILTSILAKIGIEGVNSNLTTALRIVVVLLMAWRMVFITGT